MTNLTSSLESFIRGEVEQKGLAIMGHIICGYPSFDANWEILEEMEIAGVSLVELQFPFSEPIADGPLFLKANQESIENGTRLADCFAFMGRASKRFNFKILMMGYYNTVFKTGEEEFCCLLQAHGATGLIIPDLPLEEADVLLQQCDKYGLSLIPLIAPTSTYARKKQILKNSSGFVYAVARKGVTGAKTEFSQNLDEYLKEIRNLSSVPVAVGFGLSRKADIDYLKGKAEIAIIGTAVLKTYLEKGRTGVRKFFASLRVS